MESILFFGVDAWRLLFVCVFITAVLYITTSYTTQFISNIKSTVGGVIMFFVAIFLYLSLFLLKVFSSIVFIYIVITLGT